jgi:uncharacterized membrane protein
MPDGQSLPVPAAPGPAPSLQSSSPSPQVNVRFFNTRNLAIVVSGCVFIFALWKSDPKDVPQIVQIICGSRDIALLGWIIAFIVLAVAIVFIMILCKIHDREIERISKERDRLQEMLLKKTGGQNENA